jgi:Bifunctional DNA primase/polymerase, N-terminal
MPDSTPNPFIEAFEAGLSPIPVDTATKRPKVAWKTFQTAPADLLQCQEWEGQNIGVVCGAVSGRLLCLDFEAGFMDQMPELVERLKAAGCYETFYGWVGGYSEETARGGLHVLVRLEGDGPTEGNRKLAMASPTEVLIETRGEGGYVVVAPSRNGTRGWTMLHGGFDRIAYATLEEWSAVVAVLETFDTTAPPPVPAMAKPPTPSILRLGNSWIDDELARLPSLRTVLSSMGWEPDGRHDQYGEHWVRPGKDSRLGHSASISAADRLYVHSTNAGLETGNPTHDALDVILGTQLGRRPTADERTEYLRRNAQRPPAELAGAGATPAVRVAELNLPASFWESRPYLTHVHQAALAQRLSPDAVWEGIKCFYAATIPWNHRLPGDGTMDYISIVVGASGAGKSLAKHAAYLLLEDLWGIEGVAFPIPTGSGEGMTEVFIDRTDSPERYKLRGAGFYADEGQFLLDIHGRQGNTTMQAIKQLWSGELTGQVAASADRHRWLGPRDVRATLLISATPDTAAAFMRADLTDGGLPQRVSWGWAHYPHPDDAPAHPGKLIVARHDHNRAKGGPYVVDLDPELAALIDAQRLAASRGEATDGLSGHAVYATLKSAAIHAHLDGRMRITMTDWDLAAQDWEVSASIRQYLLASQQRASQDRNVAAGVARAHSRLAESDVYLERAVLSLATKAKRAKEPLMAREIKDHLRAFSKRYGIDHHEVIALAINRGLLRKGVSGGYLA